MLVNPNLVEDVTSGRDKPHLICGQDSEVIIAGQAIDTCTGTHIFIVGLEPQAAAFYRASCTIGVPVKRSRKVLPSVILEDGVVLCGLLRLVIKGHNDPVVHI